MADLLIRGLHLPENWEMESINIDRDGKVTRPLDLNCEQIAKAVVIQSADVVLVRHGRWEMAWREDDGYRWPYHSCSICHKDFERFWNYCPNCGARMDGGEDETSEADCEWIEEEQFFIEQGCMDNQLLYMN